MHRQSLSEKPLASDVAVVDGCPSLPSLQPFLAALLLLLAAMRAKIHPRCVGQLAVRWLAARLLVADAHLLPLLRAADVPGRPSPRAQRKWIMLCIDHRVGFLRFGPFLSSIIVGDDETAGPFSVSIFCVLLI